MMRTKARLDRIEQQPMILNEAASQLFVNVVQLRGFHEKSRIESLINRNIRVSGDSLHGLQQIFNPIGHLHVDIDVGHQSTCAAKAKYRLVLKLVNCRFRPELRQRRIRYESFVQQEITMSELFFHGFELCIKHLALCHDVLLESGCELQKLTLCHKTSFENFESHSEVVVMSHF